MIVDRFVTVLADTPAARDIHHRVRYRVFCEETGFEDATQFPDQMERDRFDSYAQHFIVWDRLEREWVGAMRLVPAAVQALPCELLSAGNLKDLHRRRDRSVEFSRLGILARHRKTERGFKFGAMAPDGARSGNETSVFFRQEDNEIFLRLLRASTAWGQRNGVDYCYFIINRATTRLLTRFGIPLQVVGEPFEHRGMRTPQSYNIHEAELGMRKTLPGFVRMSNNADAFVTYSRFIGGPDRSPNESANLLPFPNELAWHHQQRPLRTANSRLAIEAAS